MISVTFTTAGAVMACLIFMVGMVVVTNWITKAIKWLCVKANVKAGE